MGRSIAAQVKDRNHKTQYKSHMMAINGRHAIFRTILSDDDDGDEDEAAVVCDLVPLVVVVVDAATAATSLAVTAVIAAFVVVFIFVANIVAALRKLPFARRNL